MRDFCDLESFDVYTEQLVRARKPHRCCETRRVIENGEWYWRCKGLCDGVWETYHQSWAAYRLARSINHDPTGRSACWIPFRGLAEEVLEQVDQGNFQKEEWDAVCRGVVTRPPVGDEAERVAALGISPPMFEEFQRV